MSNQLQVGWQRAGHEMAYYREQQQEDAGDRPRMYIMSFLIQFPHSQDTVYLAHCYPFDTLTSCWTCEGCAPTPSDQSG